MVFIFLQWGKCHKTQSKQQHEGQMSSIQKSKLMEAQRILSEWTASLKAIPEVSAPPSVCVSVCVRERERKRNGQKGGHGRPRE